MARNIAKSSKYQPQTLLSGSLQGMIIGFQLYRKKYFLFKIERFKAVKINFGSNFESWVFFHTAILQSGKFKVNLGWTVVVLPL